MIYAEVIGDPVAQSKSPLIHKHWLNQLGLSGDYRRTHVQSGDLAEYFANRRADPEWRGCNVTIPHKEAAARLVDEPQEAVRAIGAVNCVFPRHGRLAAINSDVDGIAAALDQVAVEGRRVGIIGGGGAARAALAYLASRRPEGVNLLVRDPNKVGGLGSFAPDLRVQAGSLEAAGTLLKGAALIINASPLGMRGSPEMPDDLLAAVGCNATGATFFDMVYQPLTTQFLAAGREAGARTVDGLTMLIGQAARAFELFFDAPPPPADETLRDFLIADRRDSA